MQKRIRHHVILTTLTVKQFQIQSSKTFFSAKHNEQEPLNVLELWHWSRQNVLPFRGSPKGNICLESQRHTDTDPCLLKKLIKHDYLKNIFLLLYVGLDDKLLLVVPPAVLLRYVYDCTVIGLWHGTAQQAANSNRIYIIMFYMFIVKSYSTNIQIC